MTIWSLILCLLLWIELPLMGYGTYYLFLENRKIYFLTPKTFYKGRVHVDLATNFSGHEERFCKEFDSGKLKFPQTQRGLLGAMGLQQRGAFFSPLQCGDGDPIVSLNMQLKKEEVFERIAVMCDANQVPNCIRYAKNSRWAKERWTDDSAIKKEINDVFNEGMEVRIRDFLAVGGHYRASSDSISCLLFRNELCGDRNDIRSLFNSFTYDSSKYSSPGEQWFMTQAIHCDAHLISPCIFHALYSNWAKTKWPTLHDRKKHLFNHLKKQREKRVNDIVKQLSKKKF